jgi:hypothetical protein
VPELEPLAAVRVVAAPGALNARGVPDGAIVLRIAPDEALVVGPSDPGEVEVADEHAIVATDGGWSGAWVTPEEAAGILAAGAEWEPATDRPVLAQGMVAGIPAKLWLEPDRALIVVQSVLAAELAERIA